MRDIYGHALPQSLIDIELKEDEFADMWKDVLSNILTTEARCHGHKIDKIYPSDCEISADRIESTKYGIDANRALDRDEILTIFEDIDADTVLHSLDADIYNAICGDPEKYITFSLKSEYNTEDAESWLRMYEGKQDGSWLSINRDHIIYEMARRCKGPRPWRNWCKAMELGAPVCEAFDFVCWAIQKNISYTATLQLVGLNPNKNLEQYHDSIPFEQSTTKPIQQPTNKTNKTTMAVQKTDWKQSITALFPTIAPTVTYSGKDNNRETLTYVLNDSMSMQFTHSERHLDITINDTEAGERTWLKNIAAATALVTQQFTAEYPNEDACILKVTKLRGAKAETADVPAASAAPSNVDQTAPTTTEPEPAVNLALTAPVCGLWIDPNDADAPFYVYQNNKDKEDELYHVFCFEKRTIDDEEGHIRAREADIRSTLDANKMTPSEDIPSWVISVLNAYGVSNSTDALNEVPTAEPVAETTAPTTASAPNQAPVMQVIDTMAFMGAMNDLASGKRTEVKLSDYAETAETEEVEPTPIETAVPVAPKAETKAESEADAKRHAIDKIRDRVLKMDIHQLMMVNSFIAGMDAQAAI